MSATIAAIKGTGEVIAVNAQGQQRILKVGDFLQKGETLRTPVGTSVLLVMMDDATQLQVAENQAFHLDDSVIKSDMTPTALDSSITNAASLDTIVQALERGTDLSTSLDATAAGLTVGGDSGGHSFVQLLRLSEEVGGNNYNFNYEGLGVPPIDVGVGQVAANATAATLPSLTIKIFAVDIVNAETGEYKVHVGAVPEGSTAHYVALAVDAAGNPLTTQPAGTVHINFVNGSAEAGKDFAGNALDLSIGQTFSADINKDAVYDPAEAFQINVDQFSSAGNYSSVTYIDANTEIDDQNTPQMTISPVTVEEGSSAVFNVTVGEAKAPYTVTFGTNLDGSANSNDIGSTLVVKAGDTVIEANPDGSYTVPAGVTALTVTVSTINDSVYEGPETFHLTGKTEFMAANTSGLGTITDNQLDIGVLQVTEEALRDGLMDSNPSTPDSSSASSSTNVSTDLDLRLSAPTDPVSSGGKIVIWTLSGDGHVLTGSVEGSNVVVVSLSPGDNGTWSSSTQLYAPVDHPDTTTEDVLSLHVPVSVYQSVASSVAIQTADLSVDIYDDSPQVSAVNLVMGNAQGKSYEQPELETETRISKEDAFSRAREHLESKHSEYQSAKAERSSKETEAESAHKERDHKKAEFEAAQKQLEAKQHEYDHAKGKEREHAGADLEKAESARDDKKAEYEHAKEAFEQKQHELDLANRNCETKEREYEQARQDCDSKAHDLIEVSSPSVAVSSTSDLGVHMGADGWGSLHLSLMAFAPGGDHPNVNQLVTAVASDGTAVYVQSGGHYLTYSETANGLVATTVGDHPTVVFTVAIDRVASTYTVTLHAPIDPVGSEENAKDISMAFKLVATDGDGDTGLIAFHVTIDANNDHTLSAISHAAATAIEQAATTPVATGQVLYGGDGANHFKWGLSDLSPQSEDHAIGSDVIKNLAVGANKDVLDLKDLLVGEHSSGPDANLSHYLHFSESGTGVAARVVLSIDHDGGDTFQADQTIKLDNFGSLASLQQALGAASTSDSDLLTKMIANGNLKIDT